jgi:hypothetical protein
MEASRRIELLYTDLQSYKITEYSGNFCKLASEHSQQEQRLAQLL